MNPEEADSAYETEKKKLEETYLKGLSEAKDSKTLRAAYDKGLAAAIEKYKAEYTKIIKNEQGRKKREAKLQKVRKVQDTASTPIKKFLDSLSNAFREH